MCSARVLVVCTTHLGLVSSAAESYAVNIKLLYDVLYAQQHLDDRSILLNINYTLSYIFFFLQFFFINICILLHACRIMTDSGKCVRLCTSACTLYFKSIILDYTIVYYLYDNSAYRVRAIVSVSMRESISCKYSLYVHFYTG